MSIFSPVSLDIILTVYNVLVYVKDKNYINKKAVLNTTFFNHFLWWAGMDSNHRTQKRTDLQSAAFSHFATYPNIKIKFKWCSLKDSNLGPTGYEPVALTN